MKKASLKPQAVGYPVYHAVAQLNRSFEDCVLNLNHLMSFKLLDPDSLRTYEAMIEEVRALVNQTFGDFINGAELENATYYEQVRLTLQREQPQEPKKALAVEKRTLRLPGSRDGKKVRR